MNRLGTAISAIPVLVEASGLGFDPTTPQVVCTTNAFAVAEFPRRAHVDALVSLSGSATSGVEVDLVFSLNGGSSWSALSAQSHRALRSAGRWSHSRVLGHRDPAVGDSVRFGVRVGRGALPGSGLIVDGSCRLRIRFDNRNAGTSPFDE